MMAAVRNCWCFFCKIASSNRQGLIQVLCRLQLKMAVTQLLCVVRCSSVQIHWQWPFLAFFSLRIVFPSPETPSLSLWSPDAYDGAAINAPVTNMDAAKMAIIPKVFELIILYYSVTFLYIYKMSFLIL